MVAGLFHCVSFFGLFTLFIWGCLLGQVSFDFVLGWFPILLPLHYLSYRYGWKEALVFCSSSQDYEKNNEEEQVFFFDPTISFLGLTLSGLVALTAIGVTALKLDSGFGLTWVLMTFSLIILCWPYILEKQISININCLTLQSPVKHVQLAFTGVLLVVIYLFSRWSNSDDTHFVSYSVGLLSFPELSIMSFDTLFGIESPNRIHALNYSQSWEFIPALISSYSGVSHLVVYYFFIPAIALFFLPTAVYACLSPYIRFNKLLYVVAFLLLMGLWATDNHLHGQFFLPRFYQGKSVLIFIFLPIVFLLTSLFLQTRKKSLGCLTILAIIGAGGASSTGLYLSVFVAGLAALCFARLNIQSLILSVTIVVLMCLPNLFMSYQTKLKIDSVMGAKHAPTAVAAVVEVNNEFVHVTSKHALSSIKETKRDLQSMYWLFGSSANLFVFLVLIYTSVFIASLRRTRSDKLISLTILVLFAVGFSHPVSNLLTIYVGPGNVIWRYHWIIPFSLIIGFFLYYIRTFTHFLLDKYVGKFNVRAKNRISISAVLFCIGILSLYFFDRNGFRLNSIYSSSPHLVKIDKQLMSIVGAISPDLNNSSKILADKRLAEILPMQIGFHRVIASRPLYWVAGYFSKEEIKLRSALLYLVTNPEKIGVAEVDYIHKASSILAFSTLLIDGTKIKNVERTKGLLQSRFNCSTLLVKWIRCEIQTENGE